MLRNGADSLPPAYVADGSGRPMHSWRVLILPYLQPYVNEPSAYAQYRFDKPWDGPTNSRLGDRIPHVYQCPTDAAASNGSHFWTSYVAIVGQDTCWPGAEAIAIRDVSDGTSITLQVVEVRSSGIHWMEPRDLHVVQMAPTINPPAGQGISSAHEAGAHVTLADGSVRFIGNNLPPETVRRLIERDDGEDVGDF